MAQYFPFQIVCYSIQTSFLREYPHAIAEEEKDLFLEIKQYIPHDQLKASAKHDGSPDAVTIIAAGGVGFIKELYEPLFAELLLQAQSVGLNIRAIWMADPVNTGASAVRNRSNLGCDPSWWDHSHDLWRMIDHFRTQMIRPIMGLGHSMGANQLYVALEP
jgi:hypothetical protein